MDSGVAKPSLPQISRHASMRKQIRFGRPTCTLVRGKMVLVHQNQGPNHPADDRLAWLTVYRHPAVNRTRFDWTFTTADVAYVVVCIVKFLTSDFAACKVQPYMVEILRDMALRSWRRVTVIEESTAGTTRTVATSLYVVLSCPGSNRVFSTRRRKRGRRVRFEKKDYRI